MIVGMLFAGLAMASPADPDATTPEQPPPHDVQAVRLPDLDEVLASLRAWAADAESRLQASARALVDHLAASNAYLAGERPKRSRKATTTRHLTASSCGFGGDVLLAPMHHEVVYRPVPWAASSTDVALTLDGEPVETRVVAPVPGDQPRTARVEAWREDARLACVDVFVPSDPPPPDPCDDVPPETQVVCRFLHAVHLGDLARARDLAPAVGRIEAMERLRLDLAPALRSGVRRGLTPSDPGSRRGRPAP